MVLELPGVVVVLVVDTSDISTPENSCFPPDPFHLMLPVTLWQASSMSARRITFLCSPHVFHLTRTLVPTLEPLTRPRLASQPLARLTSRPVMVMRSESPSPGSRRRPRTT